MAKDDDLQVLGTTRADRETGEHADEAIENAEHSWSASAAFRLFSVHDRIFGPHCILRSWRAIVPWVGEPVFRAGVSHRDGAE